VRDAEELDAARIGLAKIEEAFEQSRLSGAVHANQAEALSSADIQREVAQGIGAPVTLAHALETQGELTRRHGGGRTYGSGENSAANFSKMQASRRRPMKPGTIRGDL
jgi:hypothetical protein